MRRATIIYNESAGLRRKANISEQMQRHLDEDWSVELVHVTPERLRLGQLSDLLHADLDLAIAVGGDGTVAACASALHGRPTALAIIPFGTCNVIARNLGIPFDLNQALYVATQGTRKRIDIGETGGSYFVMAAGIGLYGDFFSRVSSRVKASIGVAAYGIATFALLDARPDKFILTLDEREPVETAGYGVLVGDLSRFRKTRRLWPSAATDDGRFEAVVLKRHPVISAIVPSDRFVVEWFQGKNVKIQATREHHVMLDGEILTSTCCLSAACRQNALTVCVPDDRSLRRWNTPLDALRS